MLKLRPHHLLCIEFFEGKGYSKKFTENMYKVISQLQQNPEISVTTGQDIICSECPTKCTSGKAVTYDKKVIEYCSISKNDILKYSDLKNKIKSQILEKNLLEKICPDCQWYNICSRKNAGGK